VVLYDDHPAACGVVDDPREWSRKCAHWPGAQRDLRRGDEPRFDRKANLHADSDRRTAVTGTVAYSAIATLRPGRLAYNTNYTAIITIGVLPWQARRWLANYVWSFKTITQPACGDSNVLRIHHPVCFAQVLSATFNER